MDNSHKGLLSEFPPHSREDWERKIAGDCQGIDIEKELVWQTHENIKVNPFYCSEDTDSLDYLKDFALKFRMPEIENRWKIRQDIKVSDYREAGAKALFITENGVDAPGFDIRGLKPGRQDYLDMLQGIDLSVYPVHWLVDGKYINEHLEYLTKTGMNEIRGSSCIDPLGDMMAAGNFGCEKYDYLSGSVLLAMSAFPNTRLISANGYIFQNKGAGSDQELACALSMAAWYINAFSEKGVPAGQVINHIKMDFGISGNYFFEIAKLRAARVLWAALISAFGVDPGDYPLHIESCSSLWNKTMYESKANILRSVTEAMSAIIGGCDTIKLTGYDACYRNPGEHSLRIARNIPVILREECGFSKVIDPSAGSYYIEKLTDEICEKAWELFLELEKHGGFIEASEKGIIDRDIERVAGRRLEMAANGSETILGTNLYPDACEAMSGIVEDNTLSRGVRASSQFEKLRLAMERHNGEKPVVFLVPYGNTAWRNARLHFSAGFFAAGGYEIIESQAFKTPEEGVSEALKIKADIIVFCSSDEEYEALVPVPARFADSDFISVVAGKPDCMDRLREKGISGFIYSGVNIVKTLAEFHSMMGITL